MSDSHLDLSRRAILAGFTAYATFSAKSACALETASHPPLFETNISQFIIFDPPGDFPSIQLRRIDGKLIDFARFRGKVILVHFWATWCPPCRRELKLLDELLSDVSSEKFEIAAISVDKGGHAAVRSFLKQINIKKLQMYLDPDAQIAKSAGNEGPAPFILYGLPVTYIVDRRGSIAGYVTGEADWRSAAALALLQYYMTK